MRSKLQLVTVVLLAGSAVVLMISLVSTDGSPSTTTTSVRAPVPKFKGLSVTESRAFARTRGGRVYVALRIPSGSPVDTVLNQTPNPTWPVGLVVSSGPLRSDHEILPGERTPPVRGECAVAVWLSEDGNAYPLTCSRRRVNVGAWLFYARNRPSMMSLSPTTPLARVTSSLCHYTIDEPKGFNLSDETLPEQENVFMLAAVYNGWRVPKGLSCAHATVAP